MSDALNIPASKVQTPVAKPIKLEVDSSALSSPFSSSGTFLVKGPIYDKWKALADQKTAGGAQGVQAYLGYPIEDETEVPAGKGGGASQKFQRGMIVAGANGAAFVVYGEIYLRYAALGGVSSFLGRPTSDEENAEGGGRVSKFAGGDIYWLGVSGANEVHGAIRERYLALRGPGGPLGYPTCGETQVMSRGKEIGRFNRFSNNGAIYWSGTTGAWEVYGPVLSAWEGEAKGVSGVLGFPIAAQEHMPAKKSQFMGISVDLPETDFGTFQRGAIVSHASGPTAGAHVVHDLDLFMQSFTARGSHTFWEDLGVSGDWLYVDMTVTDKKSNKVIKSQRIPASGHWGASQTLNEKQALFSGARGDLAFEVAFNGWDAVNSGSDKHLGTASGEYNAQNLWGIGQVSNSWTGDFLATYSIETTIPFNAADFREEMWWGFHNFSTAELSWDTFAQTYSDVQESEIHWEHPFDYLFYTLAYQHFASGGNCFGMAIESVYAQIGRSLFGEPIVTYAQDATDMQEINIKMGYQLGGDFIDWFLGQWISDTVRDPINTFNVSRDQFNRGDLPVISIATNKWGGDGHCVRPYRWYDGDYPNKPGKLVIAVANPNSPGVKYTYQGQNEAAVPDNDPSCLIVIDKASNTFELSAAQGSATIYSGGKGSGGLCFSIPFCEFSSQPRTPFWEALAMLVAGTLIIFAGDGQTQQITDGSGRTFYEPDLAAPPTTVDEVRKDKTKRIPNMARIPKLGAGAAPSLKAPEKTAQVEARLKALGHVTSAPSFPEVYYLHGDGGELTHEFVAHASGTSQWHMRSAGLGVVVTLPAEAGKKDVVNVAGVSRNDATVTITSAANGAQKHATVSLSGGSRTGASTFTLSNLALTPGKALKLSLAADGSGVNLNSPDAASSFDLAVQTGAAEPRTFRSLSLDSGKAATLALASGASGPVNMKVLDRPGGTVLTEKALN